MGQFHDSPRGWRHLPRKTHPSVSIVRLRVGARCVERALDRVCGAGDVGAAFDVCECGHDQNHQQRNDADDDEQFQERESAAAATLFRSQTSEVRDRKTVGPNAFGASGRQKYLWHPCTPRFVTRRHFPWADN